MYAWLSHINNMPKKYYDRELHYIDEPMSSYKVHEENWRENGGNPRSRLVVVDGIIFNSVKECAEYLNKPRTTISNYINGRNKMPQEFVDRGLKYA